jgi:hypothetical protein
MFLERNDYSTLLGRDFPTNNASISVGQTTITVRYISIKEKN